MDNQTSRTFFFFFVAAAAAGKEKKSFRMKCTFSSFV